MTRPSFILKLYLLTVISILMLAVIPTSSAVVTPPLTKCNIKIDDPHFSNYLYRTQGIVAAKVNARSKCNKPMSDLKLVVEIYKTGLFRDYKVAESVLEPNGTIPSNKLIKNEKTWIECKSRKRSVFFGVAYASAVNDGKNMKTFKVTSERNEPLNCAN
jgi:hypothetical protein